MLEELSLNCNRFDNDRNNLEVLCKLTNLKKLYLTFCKLTSLPDEFESLESLEELYLNYNKFDNINNNLKILGELSKLKKLDLRGCELTSDMQQGIRDLLGSRIELIL